MSFCAINRSLGAEAFDDCSRRIVKTAARNLKGNLKAMFGQQSMHSCVR